MPRLLWPNPPLSINLTNIAPVLINKTHYKLYSVCCHSQLQTGSKITEKRNRSYSIHKNIASMILANELYDDTKNSLSTYLKTFLKTPD